VLQGVMVIFLHCHSESFEQLYAVTSSTPICPNKNVDAYRLHCIVIYYFNIRQILTRHYVGQRYNGEMKFKIKSKQTEARSLT